MRRPSVNEETKHQLRIQQQCLDAVCFFFCSFVRSFVLVAFSLFVYSQKGRRQRCSGSSYCKLLHFKRNKEKSNIRAIQQNNNCTTTVIGLSDYTYIYVYIQHLVRHKLVSVFISQNEECLKNTKKKQKR